MNKQTQKPEVENHIIHCIQQYGELLTEKEWELPVTRAQHEQMRVDFMLAIGMLTALAPTSRGETQ